MSRIHEARWHCSIYVRLRFGCTILRHARQSQANVAPRMAAKNLEAEIMLDHIGISVMDFARSKAFYEKALATLSISLMKEVSAAQSGAHAHAGFGSDAKPFFWIATGSRASGPLHIAFGAPRRSD